MEVANAPDKGSIGLKKSLELENKKKNLELAKKLEIMKTQLQELENKWTTSKLG